MSWPVRPNPAPGLPIESAWGIEIQNACYPQFATLASLEAAWPAAGAPDGAHAFVLADRRTYSVRSGAWVFPKENLFGLVVKNFVGPVTASIANSASPPGIQVGEFGPFTLYGNRVYALSWRIRAQVLAGVASALFGHVVNMRGTLIDSPIEYNGGNANYVTGQQAIVSTMPLDFAGAVFQGSFSGIIETGGADLAPLAINAQLVINGAATPMNIASTYLSMSDQGPRS